MKEDPRLVALRQMIQESDEQCQKLFVQRQACAELVFEAKEAQETEIRVPEQERRKMQALESQWRDRLGEEHCEELLRFQRYLMICSRWRQYECWRQARLKLEVEEGTSPENLDFPIQAESLEGSRSEGRQAKLKLRLRLANLEAKQLEDVKVYLYLSGLELRRWQQEERYLKLELFGDCGLVEQISQVFSLEFKADKLKIEQF